MNVDFMQYVYTRIKKALTGNTEYMELQSNCARASECKDYDSYSEISDELQSKAEEICYIQGYKDAMSVLVNLQ